MSDENNPSRIEAELKANQDLRDENAQLREAAKHFRDCRICAEDSISYCLIGTQLDDFLSSLE